MTILLIEDDIWLVECYSLWLRAANYKVILASTAQEALDALDTNRVDCIVLDLFLPDVNGLQVLTVLRSHADTVGIPVVLCTSTHLEGQANWDAYGVLKILDKAVLTRQMLLQAVNI